MVTANAKARRAGAEANRLEREARTAEWVREETLKQAKLARECGDEWAEHRALERLKRGW
jgi:hypothetical protein